MNKICFSTLYWVLFVCVTFFFLIACNDKDSTADENHLEPPVFVSSDPATGTVLTTTGEVDIVLIYDQNITLDTPHGITLNGEEVLHTYAAYKELKVTVELVKGTAYTLIVPSGVIKGPAGLYADQVILSFETREAVTQEIKTSLVVSDPLPQAQNVYDFLRENYRTKLISGTMSNVTWNTNEAEWVYQHTGKYPALNAVDYLHLWASPANWINYEDVSVIEDWWNRNGLVAATWHWNVPVSQEIGYEEVAFYAPSTGYETTTTFDLNAGLQEGTYENEVIRTDLEKIADCLLLLKEKEIPVIWRPLHEASGGWFWWGTKGAESYKQLWIWMFDYFESRGLNHLIWVWTCESGDHEWYPGDTYVDIIGVDIYNNHSVSDIVSEYNSLISSYPDKIVALTECGNVAEIDTQFEGGATWSWFMPWYDYDRTLDPESAGFSGTDHDHASAQWWKNAFNNDKIITLDQMPDLK